MQHWQATPRNSVPSSTTAGRPQQELTVPHTCGDTRQSTPHIRKGVTPMATQLQSYLHVPACAARVYRHQLSDGYPAHRSPGEGHPAASSLELICTCSSQKPFITLSHLARTPFIKAAAAACRGSSTGTYPKGSPPTSKQRTQRPHPTPDPTQPNPRTHIQTCAHSHTAPSGLGFTPRSM